MHNHICLVSRKQTVFKHRAQVLAMCDGVDITKLSYIIVAMTVEMFMKSNFSDIRNSAKGAASV